MSAKIDGLNQEKTRLIKRYLKLQDEVDQYNMEIYKVCCEIEVLNQMIRKEEKKKQRAAVNEVAPK